MRMHGSIRSVASIGQGGDRCIAERIQPII